MGKMMNFSYKFDQSAITDVVDLNDSFSLGTLYIMYTGSNPNGTYFSRTTVEDALPSLRNVPIVAHWNADENEIGGHDFDIVKDEDGTIRLRALTEPCGVVTDRSTLSFVTLEDSNGVQREYLKAENVILWKRQDVVRHLINKMDGVIDHSMEIEVSDGEKLDTGEYEVKKFQFTALCLLGNCRPCFDGSRLEIFSNDGIKQQIAAMMDDIQRNYSMIVNATATDCGDNTTDSQEGGEYMNTMDDTNVLADDMVGATDDATNGAEQEPATSDEPVDNAELYALSSVLRQEIYRVVSERKVMRPWGEGCEYYYIDHDEAANVVYVEEADSGKVYGMNYTTDGDAVSVDFENRTRKKIAYVDFVESEQDYYGESVSSTFAAIGTYVEQLSAQCAQLGSDAADKDTRISAMDAELCELRAFKLDVEAKEAEEARAAVFSMFTDLAGIEAYDTLVANCENMSPEEIEEKCYAIRGRAMSNAVAATTYSEKTATQKIALDMQSKSSHDDKPYGGIVERYSTKNK